MRISLLVSLLLFVCVTIARPQILLPNTSKDDVLKTLSYCRIDSSEIKRWGENYYYREYKADSAIVFGIKGKYIMKFFEGIDGLVGFSWEPYQETTISALTKLDFYLYLTTILGNPNCTVRPISSDYIGFTWFVPTMNKQNEKYTESYLLSLGEKSLRFYLGERNCGEH